LTRHRKSYSPELKERVVREVLDKSRPHASVAREFGVTESTVSRWVGRYRRTHLAGASVTETIESDERFRELEKRLQDVTAERDFLKKAAAFFARDHR
jgi:transposase-like protein